MTQFEFDTPLWGWWLLVPGLSLGLVALCMAKWRWRWRSMLASFLLITAAVIVFLLPVTWSKHCSVLVAWFERSAGAVTCSHSLMVHGEHGRVQFHLETISFPRPDSPAYRLAEVRVGTTPSRSKPCEYLLWGPKYNITKSELIEKTLGFQLCWATFPADPNHSETTRLCSVTVPDWFVILLCLPYPAFWLRRYLRTRRCNYRLAHGLCLKCAYDLRVQKSGQAGDKCPECGAAIGETVGVR